MARLVAKASEQNPPAEAISAPAKPIANREGLTRCRRLRCGKPERSQFVLLEIAQLLIINRNYTSVGNKRQRASSRDRIAHLRFESARRS